MLSSQIEWIWVHWCAAKPTHLAALVLSVPLLPLSLSLSHPRSLLCYFPQPLTSSLHVCSFHPALTSSRLLHTFQLLTAPRIFGSRRGCLYTSVFISCCLCRIRMCVSACFTEQINHDRYGSVFLISDEKPGPAYFLLLLYLTPEFQPWGDTFSQAAYKSCLFHQNWQLLTLTMALNLPITFSNIKRFVPIKPIMRSLNEELNLFWFGRKRGHLYNISVV